MEEIFKDIPGYEGHYQASTLGNIKSLKRKNHIILKGCVNKHGYHHVNLSTNSVGKTIPTHQLVAMTFLDHKPEGTSKLVCDHIDNNKLNNRLDNLQLISNRENASKDLKEGTSKYVGVYYHKSRNRWCATMRNRGDRIFIGRFKCELEAAKAYQDKLKEVLIQNEIDDENRKRNKRGH